VNQQVEDPEHQTRKKKRDAEFEQIAKQAQGPRKPRNKQNKTLDPLVHWS
jgi:DNA polymerase sigma